MNFHTMGPRDSCILGEYGTSSTSNEIVAESSESLESLVLSVALLSDLPASLSVAEISEPLASLSVVSSPESPFIGLADSGLLLTLREFGDSDSSESSDEPQLQPSSEYYYYYYYYYCFTVVEPWSLCVIANNATVPRAFHF